MATPKKTIVKAIESAMPGYKVVEPPRTPRSDAVAGADVQLPSLTRMRRKRNAKYLADFSPLPTEEGDLFGNGEQVVFIEPQDGPASDRAKKQLAVVVGDDGTILGKQG